MNRSLIKELGTELREIFELSKLIDNHPDHTPKKKKQHEISD